MKTLKPIYWNFDGLDVAFQGAIPQDLCDVLDQAKAAAQETRAKTLVEWRGECMHVAETGAKGGYAYICDTGPTGAVWFFSKNQKSTNWNIRVSVRSNALASMGLGRVRAELYRFLESIGTKVGDESISRIDYCMDFLDAEIEAVIGAPFAIDPHAFVMHSHTSRADHMDEMDVHGVSGRVTSVTCGKMPGRQVIIYDKSAEVRQKKKPEWWEHWNAVRTRQGLPPLTGNERIWRVELRAGKDHLKDRWGVTAWAQLDDKTGDVFARALDDIRYTIPSTTDSERFRWADHTVWQAARRIVADDLAEMTCGAAPGVVKDVRHEQLRQTITAQMQGLAATYSVACGTEPDADCLSAEIGETVHDFMSKEPKKFQESRKRALQRYRFIDDAAPCHGGAS